MWWYIGSRPPDTRDLKNLSHRIFLPPGIVAKTTQPVRGTAVAAVVAVAAADAVVDAAAVADRETQGTKSLPETDLGKSVVRAASSRRRTRTTR